MSAKRSVVLGSLLLGVLTLGAVVSPAQADSCYRGGSSRSYNYGYGHGGYSRGHYPSYRSYYHQPRYYAQPRHYGYGGGSCYTPHRSYGFGFRYDYDDDDD